MTTFDADGTVVREPREPKRNAIVGERVYFYETGSDNEPPVLAFVTESNNAGLCRLSRMGVGRMKLRPQEWVRHIDDPYWEKVPSRNKHNAGAWDFHPVEGPVFDKHITMAKVRSHRSDEPAEASV